MRPPTNEAGESRPWQSLAALLALWSLGVAQPLLETLASGPEFLVAHRWLGLRIVVLVLGVVVLPPVLMWLAERLVALRSHRGAIWLHRIWIAVLGGCQALLVARQLGLDGVVWVAAGLAGGAGLVIAYVRFEPVRILLRWLSLAAVVVPVVFLMSSGIRPLLSGGGMAGGDDSALDSPLVASSDASAPIVWVVADEWALSTILTPDGEIDREVFPHLAALADDSTWYRRAASVSGATELAVPALLGGTLPAAHELPVPAHRPANLFTLLPHYEIWAQEVVSFLAPPGRNLAEHDGSDSAGLDGSTGLFPLLDDLRWLYLHRITPDGLRHRLPPVSDRWRGFGSGGGVETSVGEDREAIVQRFLPRFQERLHADPMAAFDRFVDALGPGEQQVYFLHLLLPHTPYRYLPDGRRYRIASELVPGLAGERWGPSQARVDQAHQRYLLQARLMEQLVGRLVARMKEVGLYDEGALVLASDHGISFHAGELRRTATADNAHELLPVPLFVKAPGQTDGRVEDAPFSLVDVLPTVLDLVDPASAPRPRESAGWTEGRLPLVDGAAGLSWLDPAFLDRQDAVETRLRRFTHPPAGGIPLPAVFRELVGRPLDEFGEETSSSGASVALDDRLLPLGPGPSGDPGAPVSALLRGRLLDAPDDCCDLAIAIDGRVVATLRVDADVQPLFSLVVLPPNEPARPEIFRIVGEGADVRLLRFPVVDAPVPDVAPGIAPGGAG